MRIRPGPPTVSRLAGDRQLTAPFRQGGQTGMLGGKILRLRCAARSLDRAREASCGSPGAPPTAASRGIGGCHLPRRGRQGRGADSPGGPYRQPPRGGSAAATSPSGGEQGGRVPGSARGAPTAASREIGGCHLPPWGRQKAGCGFARGPRQHLAEGSSLTAPLQTREPDQESRGRFAELSLCEAAAGPGGFMIRRDALPSRQPRGRQQQQPR